MASMTSRPALAVAVCAIVFPSAVFAQRAVSDAQQPLFSEPRIIGDTLARLQNFGGDDTGRPKDGFYPELGQMITGSGWISAGPGYRHHLFGGHALVEASAGISWRLYKAAQARFELPYLAHERLAIGSKVLWQDFTQVRYFGVGTDTQKADISDYRLRSTNVVGYAAWRPRPHLVVTGAAGVVGRPRLSESAGAFDRDDPDTLTVHADDPAVSRLRQPRFTHAEVAVAFDTRNHPSYPTSGGIVRGAMSTYRDQAGGAFTFNRYETEAAGFVPVARRGVFAAHVWTVFSSTAAGREVPFYFLPALGGHNTLRGYDDYRFHDRHLLVANLESRWALLEHVDGAVFFEAGNVAGRAVDLDFDRTSVGVGLRLHTEKTTLARFDVGHSPEGWRVLLKLSDSLRLGRFNKRTAPLPFVP